MAPKRLISGNPRTEQARQERLMQVIERTHERAVAKEIRRAMDEAVSAWVETGSIPLMADHRSNIQSTVFAMAQQSVRVFGARILMAQRSDNLVVERKDFASTLAKLATRYIQQETVRQRITSISETTRNQIVQATARGFDDGLGVGATARLIRDVAPTMSRTRAALISRTETHSAANYGANAAAKETGLEIVKEWVAANDERTREAHADADGQQVPLDDAFEVGGEFLMYPGDPAGSAENTINCRCSISHIVLDV
jgi:uncharacterized protein with gpF-like domain